MMKVQQNDVMSWREWGMLGYPAQKLLTEGATTQLLVTIALPGLFQLWEAALTCENTHDGSVLGWQLGEQGPLQKNF